MVIIFCDVNVLIFSLMGIWDMCQPLFHCLSSRATLHWCSVTMGTDPVNISLCQWWVLDGNTRLLFQRQCAPWEGFSSASSSAGYCSTWQAAAHGAGNMWSSCLGSFPWCPSGGYTMSSEPHCLPVSGFHWHPREWIPTGHLSGLLYHPVSHNRELSSGVCILTLGKGSSFRCILFFSALIQF